MFSSIASSLGSPGQSNYAAANAFMDALCEYRKRQGLPANSIAWGPWAEVGMAKELISRHAKTGILGLKPAEGLRTLEIALAYNRAEITIVNIHWKNYLKQMIEAPSWLAAFVLEKASENNFLTQLDATPENERAPLLKFFVTDAVRSVLGLSSSQAIQEEKGFFDIGMDSLMAIELKNRLQAGLGKSLILAPTVVFDHSSIEKIAAYILKLLIPEKGSEEVPQKRAEEESKKAIFEMSMDEVLKKLEGGKNE
jgi:acyl carrier protein